MKNLISEMFSSGTLVARLFSFRVVEGGERFPLVIARHALFCHCEELCDEAISKNTPPLGLPRLRLAMTRKELIH